jgi:hypothetical protein
MKNQILSFLDKVQEMRQLQSYYFKLRGDAEKRKGVLIRILQLEIEIDQSAAMLKLTVAAEDNLELTERARVIGELMSLSVRTDNASKAFINGLIDDLKEGCKDQQAAGLKSDPNKAFDMFSETEVYSD